MTTIPVKPINVGVIGTGYWGKNLIRVFNGLSGADVRLICDKDERKFQGIQAHYPHLRATTNSEDIFRNEAIDAVLIATPVSTHYTLARRALQEDKHVWIEKPMTTTVKEAATLQKMADEKKRVLLVDHTFLYTPAVRKMKEIIEHGELQEIRYLDSARINLGLIQPDVNVIYDLAAHDIAIFNYILDAIPTAVNAVGASHVTKRSKNSLEEIAYLNLHYPKNILAHIRVSWLSPVKMRKMLVGGSRKMILYDDVEPIEKIKIYDHGVEVDFEKDTTFEPIYRSGDVTIPHLANTEALQTEAEHFIQCIHERQYPLTDAKNGIAVMKVLEAANASMRKKGKLISIV